MLTEDRERSLTAEPSLEPGGAGRLPEASPAQPSLSFRSHHPQLMFGFLPYCVI